MNEYDYYSPLFYAGVTIKSKVELPAGTRLIASKPDDGFSDDDDDGEKDDDEDEKDKFGPSAYAYVSDEEEVDSDESQNGPLEAEDPWGVSLQVLIVPRLRELIFVVGLSKKAVNSYS